MDRIHETIIFAPSDFQVNLRDLLEQYPILALNLCEPVFNHLFILLFVDKYRLCRMIMRHRLHLCQLLPVQTQILISPFARQDLRRATD